MHTFPLHTSFPWQILPVQQACPSSPHGLLCTTGAGLPPEFGVELTVFAATLLPPVVFVAAAAWHTLFVHARLVLHFAPAQHCAPEFPHAAFCLENVATSLQVPVSDASQDHGQ